MGTIIEPVPVIPLSSYPAHALPIGEPEGIPDLQGCSQVYQKVYAKYRLDGGMSSQSRNPKSTGEGLIRGGK